MQSELAHVDGLTLAGMGKFADAEEALRRALRARQWPLVQTIAVRMMLVVGFDQQRALEGLAYRELAEELATDDRAKVMTHSAVANILNIQGKYEEAELELRRALEGFEAALGREHPHVGASLYNLANLLQARSLHAQAEVEYVRALAILEKSLGPEHPHVVTARASLTKTLQAQGKLTRAEASE